MVYMPVYISSYVSGFQSIVKELLLGLLHDVKIVNLYDGVVVYRTNKSLDVIKSSGFLNNTFLVIDTFKKGNKVSIENCMKDFVKIKKYEQEARTYLKTNKFRTFRIITSVEGKLKSVDKNILRNAENKVSKDYNVVPNRVKPEVEFWFLTRSEGVCYFLLRLTKHKSFDKTLQKGELRPDIASILCLMSEPKKQDVFWDPFCGYGAIPIQRLKFNNCEKVYSTDIESEKVNFVKNKVNHSKINKNKVSVEKVDFFHNNKFKYNSIDKIVTDPPWGDYEILNGRAIDYYKKFMMKCSGYLKDSGILVFISSKKDEIDEVLSEMQEVFIVKNKLDILLSGKKVGVYKIVKKQSIQRYIWLSMFYRGDLILKVIILAGGSGSRLWSLSRENYPKQFIKFSEMKYQLFQQTIKRSLLLTTIDEIYVVTSEKYEFLVLGELEELKCEVIKENIIIEPEAKNTLPAIYSGVHNFSKKVNDIFCVFPSDHLINNEEIFINLIKKSMEFAKTKIVTFGIKPYEVNTAYGYIAPSEKMMNGYIAKEFKEKPDYETAKKYIDMGYLWNSGIFMFDSGVFKKEVALYNKNIFEAFKHSSNIKEAYLKIKQNISVDYGIIPLCQDSCQGIKNKVSYIMTNIRRKKHGIFKRT